jgi:hypothetical protein
MKVVNIHERRLGTDAVRVGALIDQLASPQDRLWPKDAWPDMKLDRPLGVGAKGGHGPIRYIVEAYEPGRSLTCRFTGPRGFDGIHRMEVVNDTGAVLLRHTLEMQTRGPALLTWPILFRPLHDALLEDGMTKGEHAMGLEARPVPWSLRVRLLRWLISTGKR